MREMHERQRQFTVKQDIIVVTAKQPESGKIQYNGQVIMPAVPSVVDYIGLLCV